MLTVFIFVSCEEKVSLGHQNFDCRSYCGLSHRMQGSLYPLPHPTSFSFGSRPIFRAGKAPKIPFLVFFCSQTPRKRLLRRLIYFSFLTRPYMVGELVYRMKLLCQMLNGSYRLCSNLIRTNTMVSLEIKNHVLLGVS